MSCQYLRSAPAYCFLIGSCGYMYLYVVSHRASLISRPDLPCPEIHFRLRPARQNHCASEGFGSRCRSRKKPTWRYYTLQSVHGCTVQSVIQWWRRHLRKMEPYLCHFVTLCVTLFVTWLWLFECARIRWFSWLLYVFVILSVLKKCCGQCSADVTKLPCFGVASQDHTAPKRSKHENGSKGPSRNLDILWTWTCLKCLKSNLQETSHNSRINVWQSQSCRML